MFGNILMITRGNGSRMNFMFVKFNFRGLIHVVFPPGSVVNLQKEAFSMRKIFFAGLLIAVLAASGCGGKTAGEDSDARMSIEAEVSSASKGLEEKTQTETQAQSETAKTPDIAPEIIIENLGKEAFPAEKGDPDQGVYYDWKEARDFFSDELLYYVYRKIIVGESLPDYGIYEYEYRLYDTEGFLVYDWSGCDYRYVFGNYYIGEGGITKAGTGEIIVKDAASLEYLSQNRALCLNGEGYILSLIDEKANIIGELPGGSNQTFGQYAGGYLVACEYTGEGTGTYLYDLRNDAFTLLDATEPYSMHRLGGILRGDFVEIDGQPPETMDGYFRIYTLPELELVYHSDDCPEYFDGERMIIRDADNRVTLRSAAGEILSDYYTNMECIEENGEVTGFIAYDNYQLEEPAAVLDYDGNITE